MCADETDRDNHGGDFADLRKSGGIYVGKTMYFHRLASDLATRMFFLARPRRFGKSLMITALKAIFQGRRGLFDGLAVANTDWKSWGQTLAPMKPEGEADGGPPLLKLRRTGVVQVMSGDAPR